MTITDNRKLAVHEPTDMDEDLDDLDDVLSQFSSTPSGAVSQQLGASPVSPPPPPPTATATTSFHRPRTNTRVDAPPFSVPGSGTGVDLGPTSEVDEDALSAEFSRELAKGMESLMREISASATSTTSPEQGTDDNENETDRVLKAAWEAMLIEGMNGMPGAHSSEQDGKDSTRNDSQEKNGGRPIAASGGSNDFQNRIRQTLHKVREGESSLQADSTPMPDPGVAGAGPESLDALLNSLNELGLGGGEGGDDETEFAGLLENMMGQLMSKEVLYDPLKDLSNSFPPYLAKPPAPLPAADKQRYESQLNCVHKILAVFDGVNYSDNDPTMIKNISDLMAEMQSYGSPPPEIMGPLPPGMGLGPDGVPQIGEGCVLA